MGPTVQTDAGEVRTNSKDVCYLCGNQGAVTYPNISDARYGMPGVWNFRKCASPICDLLWLDPCPFEEDTSKLYYYFRVTHEDPTGAAEYPAWKPKRLLRLGGISDSYLATQYGYRGSKANALRSALVYLRPAKRADIDFPFRPLADAVKGRLLDVGCGAGATIRIMREWGWEAEGIDFDAKAVDNARRKGLNVRLGSLSDQMFPDGTFDAVIMSHVIEHVHDPIGFLHEAHRVLKPGGRVVLATPNGWSAGHKLFKSKWAMLSPPAHLFIFNPPALATILRKAGFAQVICSSQPRWADQSFIASVRTWRHGSFDERDPQSRLLRLYGSCMSRVEWLGLKLWKNVGEEIVAAGIK